MSPVGLGTQPRTRSLAIGPAPTLIIRIELERDEPIIAAFCANESEIARLGDWLEHRPELLDLLERAAGPRPAGQP